MYILNFLGVGTTTTGSTFLAQAASKPEYFYPAANFGALAGIAQTISNVTCAGKITMLLYYCLSRSHCVVSKATTYIYIIQPLFVSVIAWHYNFLWPLYMYDSTTFVPVNLIAFFHSIYIIYVHMILECMCPFSLLFPIIYIFNVYVYIYMILFSTSICVPSHDCYNLIAFKLLHYIFVMI